MGQRPGHLTAYAKHARISKTAASVQLKRVGIDYKQPFDFSEADKRRLAMRHADRAPFAKPIYADTEHPDDKSEFVGGRQEDPAFAELQRKREHFKVELARLDYEERVGKLTATEKVAAEAFRIGRQVRDAVLNVPSRLAGILAAESDQRLVHDLLEQELRQALEVLATDQTGGSAAA